MYPALENMQANRTMVRSALLLRRVSSTAMARPPSMRAALRPKETSRLPKVSASNSIR